MQNLVGGFRLSRDGHRTFAGILPCLLSITSADGQLNYHVGDVDFPWIELYRANNRSCLAIGRVTFEALLRSVRKLLDDNYFPQDYCMAHCFRKSAQHPDCKKYATIISGAIFRTTDAWQGEVNPLMGN